MRTLVIGDIHGALKAVEQVLKKAAIAAEDQLIFLGDYVDGWSEAAETVDYLQDLNERHSCIFIRGNHDELCLDWLKEGKPNPTWEMHGGQATKESYAKQSPEKIQKHIAFFESLENHYLNKNNRLFLHAGFTNLKGIEYEYFAKSFYWDRTLWELALSINPELKAGDPHYPPRLTHYHEIFIGHTPVTRIGKTRPHQAANVWNVDTGAAFKGPLSVMDCSTKEVWQSEPVHLLYPDENGRN